MIDYSGTAATRASTTQGRIKGTGWGMSYPSPFFDVAHTYLPDTVKQMFRWCRYYTLTNPLIAAVVNKMAEYPITDVVIDTDNDGTKKLWTDFFEDTLQLRAFLVDIGLFYMCLHGDTKVVTDKGVLRIRDMEGETHNVLSEGGVYRPAAFKSYGRQMLLEVEFRDGSTVLATPEHQWPVVTSSGSIKKVPTTELKGRSIPRTVAPRPEQDEDFYEGVRHGFVFGDGTLYKNGERKQARAYFFGAKDQHMVKYYEGRGCPPYTNDQGCTVIHGLPEQYKQLPPNSAPASYWYGFVCGFLAADGSVDTYGCAVLTQKSRTTLAVIAEQLPRIGMVCGPLRGHPMSPRAIEGREIRAEGDMHFLTLLKQSMLPKDFLLPHHRARFEENYKPTEYGKYVTVRDVRETGIEDEVYCCEENETHTFVIENGVLTGNCYGNALVSVNYPFRKFLKCERCGKMVLADKAKYRFRNFKFFLECPCGHHGEAQVRDISIRSPGEIRLILWSPEDITIKYNDLTGKSTYYYTVPLGIKNDIVIGKRSVISQTPQVFIDAVRRQKAIILNPDNIFHFRRPSILTGAKDRAWGVPLVLPVLKDVFYLQILKKAQEAIALERIVPLTVLFPQPGSGSSDPYATISLSKWREQVGMEVQRWRFDRNYLPIMPLPIGSQNIGGDGRALLLGQEIRIWSEHIIAGMGVPQEFVFGGLQYSGSNVSLRMLENQLLRYVSDQLRMIKNFVVKNVAAWMDWPLVNVRFKPFKMADDLQRRAFDFQLNQAGKLSDTSLLANCDYDPIKEDELTVKETVRRLEAVGRQQRAEAQIAVDAQIIQAKGQAKVQQIMMQEQQQAAEGQANAAPGEALEGQQQQPAQAAGGQAAGGQAAGGQGPQGGKQQMAQQMAQRLMQYPPEQQQQIVQQLMQHDPELAQMVQQLLSQLVQSQQQQAQQQAQQQPQQPSSANKPLPEQLPPRRGPESAAI